MASMQSLKVDVGAHGVAVGDDDLALILVLAVPTIELDASAAAQEDLAVNFDARLGAELPAD